ncbi:hypothetical protein ACCB44_05725, partial [Staphylococcus aureus]
ISGILLSSLGLKCELQSIDAFNFIQQLDLNNNS